MSLDKRVKQADLALKKRGDFDTLYSEAFQYCAQHRDTFNKKTKGSSNNDRLFDSTGVTSLSKFVSNIQSRVIPPFKQFCKLVPGPDIPEENIEKAQEQLTLITDVFFKYLHSSNFDTQVSGSLYDLGVGTGVLLLNESDKENPFDFTSVPLSEVSFLEGESGEIRDVFRRFKIERRNINANWPAAKASATAEDASDKKGDDMIEVLECTIYNQKDNVYEYSVDNLTDKKPILEPESRDVSPWIIFRWSTMPGEIYGRGPALHALPDIKTLNKAAEILLQSAALKSIPTFVGANDGVFNPHNAVIDSGSIITTSTWGPGGPPIQALDVGGDVNLSQFIMEKMQARIEDAMYANPLGDVNLPVKSATEMSLRAQQLSDQIGSSYGRLQRELVAAVMKAGLYLLEKQGKLPVKLEDVNVGGTEVSISYQSPIARSQEEESVVNYIRYADSMRNLVGDQLLPLFCDMDVFSADVAKNMGVSNLVPNESRRKEIVGLITEIAQSNLAPPEPQGQAQQAQGEGVV